MNDFTITTRSYMPSDAKDLAQIFYNTIHHVNSKDYTPEQINAWAPLSTLNSGDWESKWEKIIPIVALIGNAITGFTEFESNGHIDCFYVHHEFQGKGVGGALMKAIIEQAQNQHIHRVFAEVSITAKPFFINQGFKIIKEQQVNIRGMVLTNFLMEKLITC